MHSKKIHFIVFALFFITCFLLSEAFGWGPIDTLRIKELGKIAISPTEKQIAYEVLTPFVDTEEGAWETEVYLQEIANSPPKVVQLDHYIPQSMVWSPDGGSILFLAKKDTRILICRFSLLTDQTEVLLDAGMNITTLFPSHSMDKLAFTSLHKPITHRAFEIVDAELPLSKLYLLDIPSKKVQLAVEGAISIGSIDWSPDDAWLVFDHQPSARVEDRVLHSKISKLELSSLNVMLLTDNECASFNPQYSLDGQRIAYVSGPGTWEFTFHVNVINLLDGTHFRLSPTPDEQVELVGWLSDGESVVVAERYHTTQRLYRLSIQSPEVEPLTPPELLVLQPKIGAKKQLLAFRSESSKAPCELFVTDLSFKPIQVSHIQVDSEIPKLNTQLISWKNTKGQTIEGLLTLPSGKAEHPLPLLVLIRGHSSLYLNTYEGGIHLAKTPYSIGVFADQGYAVLRPFFTGSSGYGRTFRNAIQGDWGGQDFDDLMTGLDALIKQGIVDPNKLGIMGWSYGGFMTANAMAKTSRFRAASAGGALVNFISYAGTTDIPLFLPHFMNGFFWDHPEIWRDHSPIEHVRNMKTPTLIQHCMGDKRVPPSQAFELYNALKQQGVPAQLILYSETGHSLNNPQTIIEGIQHNLNWFNFWLKGESCRYP